MFFCVCYWPPSCWVSELIFKKLNYFFAGQRSHPGHIMFQFAFKKSCCCAYYRQNCFVHVQVSELSLKCSRFYSPCTRWTEFLLKLSSWSKSETHIWGVKIQHIMCKHLDVQINPRVPEVLYCINSIIVVQFNPSKTNGRLLYLKTQFVPRSKHFSSRL